MEQIGSYKSEKENVDEDILLLGKPGSPHSVEVDLMVPIDQDKSPKVHVHTRKTQLGPNCPPFSSS